MKLLYKFLHFFFFNSCVKLIAILNRCWWESCVGLLQLLLTYK